METYSRIDGDRMIEATDYNSLVTLDNRLDNLRPGEVFEGLITRQEAGKKLGGRAEFRGRVRSVKHMVGEQLLQFLARKGRGIGAAGEGGECIVAGGKNGDVLGCSKKLDEIGEALCGVQKAAELGSVGEEVDDIWGVLSGSHGGEGQERECELELHCGGANERAVRCE